ncbi:hypothetical protein PINS_up005496 [Pythium insidiosum]|nr:hypothetical protein PINS_up005496 [Pythium insidiosum]
MSSQRIAEKTRRSDEEEELSCASPDSKGDIDSDEACSLKYVSVDELNWSSGSKKRARMTDDERKARHREVQRQFMLRKLARLEEMRRQVSFLEKQHLLLLLKPRASAPRARKRTASAPSYDRARAIHTRTGRSNPHVTGNDGRAPQHEYEPL